MRFHRPVWYGIARFLWVMRVFEDRASSSYPRLPCVKFCFFRDLHCWASPWRKIAYTVTQSIAHSFTQLIWWLGNRSTCASEHAIQFHRLDHWHRPKLLNLVKCSFNCIISHKIVCACKYRVVTLNNDFIGPYLIFNTIPVEIVMVMVGSSCESMGHFTGPTAWRVPSLGPTLQYIIK